MSLFGLAAIPAAMWRMWIPIRYELGPKGITQRILGRQLRIPWATMFIRKWLSLGSVRGHDLEDLLQDVLITMVREISQFEHSGNPGAFRSWLKTVIHYRILGYRRMMAMRKDCEQDFDKLISLLDDQRSGLSRHWDAEHDRFIVQRLLQLLRAEFSTTVWQAFQRLAIDNVQARQVGDKTAAALESLLKSSTRLDRRWEMKFKSIQPARAASDSLSRR